MPNRIGDFLIRGDFSITSYSHLDVIGRRGRRLDVRSALVGDKRLGAGDRIAGAHPVIIDIAAQSYYGSPDDPSPEDYHGIIMPWDCAWFEWRETLEIFHPQIVKKHERKLAAVDTSAETSTGFLVRSWQDEETGYRYTYGSTFIRRGRHERPMEIGMEIEMVTDADGEVLPVDFYRSIWSHETKIGDERPLFRQGCPAKAYEAGLFTDYQTMSEKWWVVIHAIGLLNCRNVTSEALPVGRKREIEIQKSERLRFSTIKLPTSRPEQFGTSSDPSQPSALHMCRGHFKDCREKGLFGKNRGIYWWSQHARGTSERGHVVSTHVV